MKKIFIGLLIGLTLGLLIGFCATNYLVTGTVPTGYVCVTVKNESGHLIKSIFLKHALGSIEMKNISINESANITFKNGGENSYCIVATFDNDSTLKSAAPVYVEAGYKTTETIFNDHIKTEQ